MALLKDVYNQVRNEYVRDLCKLETNTFMSTLAEMVSFPSVTLEISHIHQIFQNIIRSRKFGSFIPEERNKVYRQFWGNILTAERDSLLTPASDRRGVISRWFAGEWESQILESIARHPESGLTHDDWLRWIARQESRFSSGDREKNEIAYEQAYRLATDGMEKYRILLSAYKFHFSHELTEDPCPYRKGRAERMLEEHIRCFPADIPQLQKDFRELIAGREDGRARRAGWSGIAVVGAGMYEDELVELLKLRVGSMNVPRKERMGRSGTTMCTDVAEELEGMTRWVPSSENNRPTLCHLWTNMLLDGCLGRIEKNAWNKQVWAALWQARFRLETSEERLLKEIAPMMHGVFGGEPITGLKNQLPATEMMATIALWQPQSPEIRQRWRELWEQCLSRSFFSRYRPATPHVFWKGLSEMNPRDPRLGELLLQYLSENPNAANDLYSMEAITTWLREYGLPPETTGEVRAQLEQKAGEHFSRQLSSGCDAFVQRHIGELAFHIMAATPPDREENRGWKREEMAAEILGDVELLSKVTTWLENNPPAPARQWQPVIHRQWEKKLAAISSTTPAKEVEPVLEYFGRTIRRDPESCPRNILAEKVLLLIREGQQGKIVTMAARLGKQLVSQMDNEFLFSWSETVLKRARASYDQGNRLFMSLHLIRQEYVINALSGYLPESPAKKPGGSAVEKESTMGEARGEARQETKPKGKTRGQTKADRELAEKIALRELVYMFPEIGQGDNLKEKRAWDLPPRIWSPQCLNLIIRKISGGGKSPAALPPVYPMSVDGNGRKMVFQDWARLKIPHESPAPDTGKSVMPGGIQGYEASRKKLPEF